MIEGSDAAEPVVLAAPTPPRRKKSRAGVRERAKVQRREQRAAEVWTRCLGTRHGVVIEAPLSGDNLLPMSPCTRHSALHPMRRLPPLPPVPRLPQGQRAQVPRTPRKLIRTAAPRSCLMKRPIPPQRTLRQLSLPSGSGGSVEGAASAPQNLNSSRSSRSRQRLQSQQQRRGRVSDGSCLGSWHGNTRAGARPASLCQPAALHFQAQSKHH